MNTAEISNESARPRLFFAVPIDPVPPIRRLLEQLQQLRPTTRPVDPARLHLTLRFVGDMDRAWIDPLGEALRRAAAGVDAVTLRFTGLGVFPPPRSGGPFRLPRVIFVELDDASVLMDLADRLDREIASLADADRVPARDKPFTAHLTLARVESRQRRGKPRDAGAPAEALRDLLGRNRSRDLGSVRVDRVHLYESALHPTVPIHTPLHTAGLG